MLEGDSNIDTATPRHEEASEAHLSSRRSFLSGSAKLLGGGALAPFICLVHDEPPTVNYQSASASKPCSPERSTSVRSTSSAESSGT
jgi:hypothetical protein